MKRPIGVLLVILVVAACSSGEVPPWTYAPVSPSAAASPEAPASPSAEASAPASEAPSPGDSPGGSPGASGSPSAHATLTPAAPDPGVSMVGTWWLDPAMLPVDPAATVLHGFVLEKECASGQPPEGRVLAPDVDYGADALTITISIAPLSGAQDCQGNTPYGVVFELEEPVGERPIFDGGTVPARDATIPGQ